MNADELFKELRSKNFLPILIDGQLAIDKNKLAKPPLDLPEKLTQHRREIKAALLEQEEQGGIPYIDGAYDQGAAGKGCLVVPNQCKNRYKFWLEPSTFILIESDDWMTQYYYGNKDIFVKWRPLRLQEILAELGCSEDFTKNY